MFCIPFQFTATDFNCLYGEKEERTNCQLNKFMVEITNLCGITKLGCSLLPLVNKCEDGLARIYILDF